ncbi:TetR/AcrR family transcriptional regulator [Mycobacterium sp. AMU20-3851]|uniref:TetR/AcrR family transcriptional regulator n=1 Tax=Mycobacterium sp. AMU20-3851 TaxID=3122055 RepID=UPI00375433D6
MQPNDNARQRMVAGAADMLGTRGLNATGVRDVAKHAGAPLGSVYHYFPGGKTQLAAEAVRWADEQTAEVLARSAAEGPATVVRDLLDMWRNILLDGDFRRGCPVLAVAVEDLPGDDTAPRDAAVFAFSAWSTQIARALRATGVEHGTATGTATLVIAAVEGAVAMSRAERSTEPLDRVGAQLQQLIAGLGAPLRP